MGDISVSEGIIFARIFNYIEGTVIPFIINRKNWYRCELPTPALKKERPSMNEFVQDLIDNAVIYRYDYELEHEIVRPSPPASPVTDDSNSDDSASNEQPKAKNAKVSLSTEENDVEVSIESKEEKNEVKEDNKNVVNNGTINMISANILNLPILNEGNENGLLKNNTDPFFPNVNQNNAVDLSVARRSLNNVHKPSSSSNYPVDLSQPSTSRMCAVVKPFNINEPSTSNNSSVGNSQSLPQSEHVLNPLDIDLSDLTDDMWRSLLQEFEEIQKNESTDFN